MFADLIGAHLNGAQLRYATLRVYGDRAFLSFADLTGAKLQFSGFVRADLSNAILRDADFRGVNLGGADLTGADLTGANLNEAILIGANLTRVRGRPGGAVPFRHAAGRARRLPGHHGVGVPVAYTADAVPIPLLRGLEPELEVLPEAVYGQGCAASAVDARILTEPGWDDAGRRPGQVTGHCGATLVVLSDDARDMERSVGGLPPPLDGGRVVLAPADAADMRAALATGLRSGEPGSGIAVAVPAHLLLAEPMVAAGWWPAVRSRHGKNGEPRGR